MKLKFINNSILSTHYLSFLNILEANDNKLSSNNLTSTQTIELYDKKYSLTEFERYKYITVLDHAIDSLSCNKFTFTEGITSDKNRYNNILIDLFYINISQEIMSLYPISVVFSIKQTNHGEIQDLTKQDIKNYKENSPYLNTEFDVEYWDDGDTYSQWYLDHQEYKSQYKDYAGNSYTYYIFKQILKLYLTEVHLFHINNHIFTYKELLNYYYSYISNSSDPQVIKSFEQWKLDQGVEKVQYQCIKIVEPFDINNNTLSNLKIKLINVNKKGDFISMYDSIVEKTLGLFYDYNSETQNRIFMHENNF